MQLGMIGLGRMGANMVRRLMRGGHQCVVYDVHPAEGLGAAVPVQDDDLPAGGAEGHDHLSLAPRTGPGDAGMVIRGLLASVDSSRERLRPATPPDERPVTSGEIHARPDVSRSSGRPLSMTCIRRGPPAICRAGLQGDDSARRRRRNWSDP